MWVAVEEGDHEYTDKRVQEAIDAGIDPRIILDDGLFPGFNLQGDRFSAQIIFHPRDADHGAGDEGGAGA